MSKFPSKKKTLKEIWEEWISESWFYRGKETYLKFYRMVKGFIHSDMY